MPDKLSLSRAARLAGVSRGDLQSRLKKLGLEMFEGKISVANLVEAYPKIDIDADPTLERLALIREEAFSKRGRKDTALPDAEILMARLQDFQTVLTRTKASLNLAEQLVHELNDGLREALAGNSEDLRERVAELQRRLERGLKSKPPAGDREAALYAKDALLSLMSANVRLLPSGNEFFVSGQDSILEGALKAGLHMDYGCASGNCGKCRIRVVAGRVKQVRDYDFVFSVRDREDGCVLACSYAPVTDLLAEAREASKPADLPQQQIRVVVRKQIPLDEQRWLVEVQTPRTKTLRFMAGQRVSLTNEDDVSVTLPIASCPCDSRNLQFVVRRDARLPLISEDAVEDKATLKIEGPHGDFLLHEESNRPIIFVSFGDGIGPIKSLLEHSIAIDKAVTIHLFRLDSIPPGSHLGNLCRSWDDALDNFTYVQLPAGMRAARLMDELQQRFSSLGECRLYVAGPAAQVDCLRAELTSRGISPERIRFDIVEPVRSDSTTG